MLHLAIASLAVGFPLTGYAIRAKQGNMQLTQPDGTTLTVTMEGDERHHSVFTSDGYLLTGDENGLFTYAKLDPSGKIVSSGIAATDAAKRNAATQKFLSTLNTPLIYKTLEQNATAMNASGTSADGKRRGPGLCDTSFPSKGSTKAIAILVQYQDVEFENDSATTYDYFHRMLNEEGFADNGGTGSARDFFVNNSMGQFTPEFDVYGPVTLPQKRSYYGGNDTFGNDKNPEMMVVHACEILDDDVDFSQYDTDGDGFIDNVYVFYAGKGEADGGGAQTVWPHSWDLAYGRPGKKYIHDGVQLNHYACSNEIDNQTKLPDGIGTFVHEFSHVLGLPDLYATTYNSSFTPGAFSTLDYGPYNDNGRTPPHYSAYERYALDWMEPTLLTSSEEDAGVYTLEPIDISNQAFLVQTENDNEYFLIENRQWQNNDRFIPGHGMIVWHIDYDEDVWGANTVNNTPTHQHVDLVEADNVKTEATRKNDPFPGGKNKTEFTPDTKPAFVSWKKASLDMAIVNITEDEETGLITFELNPEKKPNSITEISGNGNGWRIEASTLTAGSENVEVYDFTGRNVARVNAGVSATLPSGFYIIKTASGSQKVRF